MWGSTWESQLKGRKLYCGAWFRVSVHGQLHTALKPLATQRHNDGWTARLMLPRKKGGREGRTRAKERAAGERRKGERRGEEKGEKGREEGEERKETKGCPSKPSHQWPSFSKKNSPPKLITSRLPVMLPTQDYVTGEHSRAKLQNPTPRSHRLIHIYSIYNGPHTLNSSSIAQKST